MSFPSGDRPTQSNALQEPWYPPYTAEGAFINSACDLRLPTAYIASNTLPNEGYIPGAYSAFSSSPNTFLSRPNLEAPRSSQQSGRNTIVGARVNMSGIGSQDTSSTNFEMAPWRPPVPAPITTCPAPTHLISGENRSRLPLENVARKIPRKANDGADSSFSGARLVTSVKAKSKAEHGRAVKPVRERERHCHLSSPLTKASTDNTSKSRSLAHLERGDTFPHAASRRRRVTKAGYNEGYGAKRASRNDQSGKGGDDGRLDFARPAIERNYVCRRARQRPQTPRSSSPPFNQSTSILTHCSQPPPGSLPRVSYAVPEVLKGTQTALGPDNWNRYVLLLEKLWAEEIHGDEFAAATKAMFMTQSDTMRKKINSLMIMEMIKPGLEMHGVEMADSGKKGK